MHFKVHRKRDDIIFSPLIEKPTSQKFILRAERAQVFHAKLSTYGYEVILKPLKYIKDRKTGKITTKGDTDVSISIDMKNSLSEAENIILISGDSDFLPVVQDAHAASKHIRIYSFEHTLAWELKYFAIKNTRCNYKLLDELKNELEYIKTSDTIHKISSISLIDTQIERDIQL